MTDFAALEEYRTARGVATRGYVDMDLADAALAEQIARAERAEAALKETEAALLEYHDLYEDHGNNVAHDMAVIKSRAEQAEAERKEWQDVYKAAAVLAQQAEAEVARLREQLDHAVKSCDIAEAEAEKLKLHIRLVEGIE